MTIVIALVAGVAFYLVAVALASRFSMLGLVAAVLLTALLLA